MFRFFTSESRGSDQTPQAPQPIAELVKPLQPRSLPNTTTIASPSAQPPKRRRLSIDRPDEPSEMNAPVKRIKTDTDPDVDALATHGATVQECPAASRLESARDKIRHQFGLEILLKHDELRLINQELAKCQVGLEQLRRCHLIPYPVNCPTPEDMLNVSAGKGPAVQSRPGESVPRWAPPFGVVDGPYARHYAKWLIPDPSFDGQQPEWQFTPEASRARVSHVEGRTTRNSFAEPTGALKGRSARGSNSQKLHSLSSGYPQPKDKAGPCILKRADGQTVKLVCLDCHRENFSSTQGFINHCRIAHKRDFKSHEEAAVHSGHPIEVAEGGGVGEEKSAAPSVQTPTAASVHPFARPDMTEQQAFIALRSRISDSLRLYHEGKLPGVTRIPSLSNKDQQPEVQKAVSAEEVSGVPHLSRLLQSRKFGGNLREMVADATTKSPLDDMTSGEESELTEPSFEVNDVKDSSAVRTPIVMRVPAKATNSQSIIDTNRSASSKGRAHIAFKTPSDSASRRSTAILSDEDLDVEDADMSPNTMVSNNAPSLVSDDGEYDDTDDGSSVSGASDALDAESVSDVAEITLDDDQDPRSLRRESSGVSGAVRLRKDDTKHITLMTPVKNDARERRQRKV
ncbi:ada hat complex component 1 [Fusarium longipes]|uniref:Ada hat complex component 1 n=1 Tax=Fusarium longipes TaxID=694270 RepID=A0A395RVM9_9HYPO|nr:ada hat complex component 1 [Fusarium longipes]